MKKLMIYFVAGAMVTGTACSSTDTATSDTASMETSETTTSAGSVEDETTTETESTTTTETETTTGTETMGTGTETGTGTGTGTGTETGTMGTGTDMGAGMDMTTLTNMDDATFMMTAASSNMLEIELGKMASQKATDPKVKEFGKMMVDHHTKATQNLKKVASQSQVTLPQTMMPMHQAMVDKLKNKSGAEFDEAYMDAMETAHKMDIAMFEAKTTNAQAPAVKSFASTTLPTLRSHQKMATTIEDTVD